MWFLENWSTVDPVVEFAVVTVGAVTVLSALAWMLSLVIRRHAAASHCVLLSGLLVCLVSPFVVAGFMTVDVSLVSLPSDWQQSAERGAAETRVEVPSGDTPAVGFDDGAAPADVVAGQFRVEHVAASDVAVSDPVLPVDDETAIGQAVVRSDDQATALAERPAAARHVRGRTAFNRVAIVWGCGTLILLVAIVRSRTRLFRLRRALQPAGDQRLDDLVDQITQRFGLTSRPAIAVSTELRAPVTTGLLRPLIILPAQSLGAITQEQLRDVLVHEMAHIARRDQIVVLLHAFSRALYWPIVFVHLQNRRLARVREEVCDNFVLAQRNPVSYGETLLRLAELSRNSAPLAASVGILHWRGTLEDRIAGLIDERRSRATRTGGSGTLAIVAAFCVICLLACGTTISSATAGSGPETDDSTAREADEATGPSTTGKAEEVADPYDTLYDVLMTRWKDGKAYAQNETSPSIFSWSEFPFDDQTFDKFNGALDAFAALPQEKIEQYSDVQRALMQRNLWDVFEYTFNWNWSADWWWDGQRSFPKSHIERRYTAQPKIASLIKRLALTKEQILALPNPLTATIEAGGFAETHDAADPFKPFLPRDLYAAAESSWICVGEDGEEIPADLHTGKLYSRSMFLQFMRLPGGRAETLAYMERISKRPHQFPVGTQFALLEQPILISKDGELVLSPLVVSVQLRAYLDVGRDFRRYDDAPKATQCVAEFVIQPRQLMKGNAVMRAMGPNDFHFDAGAETPTPGFSPRDPFMKGKLAGEWPLTRLKQCMDCHSRAGGRSVRTRSFRGTHGFFTEGNPEEIAKATAAQKLEHDEYKTLQKYWRGEPVELPKPTAQTTPTTKPEPMPDRFPDTPELRAALFKRVENEVAAELKTLHSAVLLAEVATLSDMFNLDESESGKLRLAAGEAANSAVEKARSSIRKSYRSNAEYTLNKKLLVDGRRNDPDLTAFRFNDRFVILNADDQDPADRNPYDSLGFELERRGTNDWLSVGFKFGRFGNTVGPKDSDVQNEEAWKQAISAVLTEQQVAQYTEYKANRLKTTIVDMMVMTLQFDLDLVGAQLPAVRRRIEERVEIRAGLNHDIERTVGPELQRLKAEALGDILSEEQLNAFPEHPKTRIKSTIISLILTALKFDLHLADSHLPVIRKRLEERINPNGLSSSVESKAMRYRWGLKEEDVADVLSEAELTLWRFTQEQHN